MREATQAQIKKATAEDPTMQTLAEVVQKGWPETCNEVSVSIRGYWGYRDEMTLQDGLVYKGVRVVIPQKT